MLSRNSFRFWDRPFLIMQINDPKFKTGQKITFNVDGEIITSKIVHCVYVLERGHWQYVTKFNELFFIPELCAVENPN